MTSLAGGRYVLTERIAAGGMGEVWRASDTALGRDVAVKLLRAHIAEDDSFRNRFAAEARHAASLHDPHIATVFDYGDEVDETTGRHATYLVMELVDGKPMSELMSSPLTADRAATLIAQAADGLAVAHAAGIVHRDVKPANFLVTPDGRVKITDFGIARARGAASLTDTGTIMGTPHYVAPEIVEGQPATPASDIYSLGVVLYEALGGVKPFVRDTAVAVAMAHLRDEPQPLPASVPPALAALVESAMAKDPAQRPPDAATFAAALRNAVSSPDAATTVTAAEDSAAPTRVLAVPAAAALPSMFADHDEDARRRISWLPVTAAVLAVLLVAGVAFALTSGDGDTTASAGQGTPSPDRTKQTAPTTSAATTSAATTSAPTATGIPVDSNTYIGMDAKEAERQLAALGLVVDEVNVAGGEKDTVANVSPSGTLQEGDLVTLSVYDGNSGSGGDGPSGDGHGPGGPGHHGKEE